MVAAVMVMWGKTSDWRWAQDCSMELEEGAVD
jgi:hypothetical protein